MTSRRRRKPLSTYAARWENWVIYVCLFIVVAMVAAATWYMMR